MQKRDRNGRFLKSKVVKKKPKKLSKVRVQKAKVYDIKDLTFWDLQDMISAEVALQMKASW